MKRLVAIFAVLLAVTQTACQDPTPTLAPTSTPTLAPTAEPPTPTPTATPAPTATPTVSAGAAQVAMLEEAAGGLSGESRACLMELFEEDPSLFESMTASEGLSGPSMLGLLACLTEEEAAALTPPGEGPPPDVAGFACLTEELEGAPERDRILAVLSGADPSGEGLTLEESAVLGEAVEACGLDTGFGFPGGGEGNPLADTEWRLVALGSADAPAAVVGGDPTAEFTTAADMTGWTGCNSYGARYSVRESELRLYDLEWTEAGCPSQELFRQEQRMQDLLATVERFEVAGDRLTLHSEGGQVLVFERVGR